VIDMCVSRFVQHPEPSVSILSADGFVANAIAIEAQQWNVVQISMSAYLNRMWRALDHLNSLGRDLLPQGDDVRQSITKRQKICLLERSRTCRPHLCLASL
jgi:hypothetical protein